MATKKLKLKPTPKLTRPTTAYNLLSRVCRLILAEPKRYNQGDWVDYLGRYDYEPDDLRVAKKRYPACGTIGCVAGWVAVLQTGTPIFTFDSFTFDSVELLAQKLLGLSNEQAGHLFDGNAIDNLVDEFKPVPAVGTKAYARYGVKHIQAFQRKYAAQLKARVVKPAGY